MKKTAKDDKLGRSVDFASHHLIWADVVVGTRCGAGRTTYHPHSRRGILAIYLDMSLHDNIVGICSKSGLKQHNLKADVLEATFDRF